MQFLLLLEFVFRGLKEELELLIEDTENFVKELRRAIPNVFRMLDLTSRFVTSLTGRLLTVPLTGLGEAFIAQLRKRGIHNRLLRLDEAVRLFIDGPKEALRQITFTSDSGIIQVLIVWSAQFIHRTIKRIRLLSWLFKVRSEEQFVEVILRVWSGKLKILRFLIWLGIVVLFLSLVVVVSAYVSIGCLCIPFITGDWVKRVLPQDSRRAWRKGGAVVRRNLRRGPDALVTG